MGMDALDQVLGRADHVCLTVPLTPETHHLMDRRRLSRLRPSAYLYNTSRGAVIDEAALIEALRAGKHAATDGARQAAERQADASIEAAAAPYRAPAVGSRTTNVVPSPTALFAVIVPPCASTMDFAT
jgi:lactate dehydrogenase-like 2-hydroxyacid dehydrogenase